MRRKKLFERKTPSFDDVADIIIDEDKEEEKPQENTMSNDYFNSEEYMKRSHLLNRLRNVFWEKSRDSENTFGLCDDLAPETGTELVQRIKDGKFMIQKYNPDSADSEDYIRWRDPALKADREGHREFMKDLGKVYETTRDQVMVLDAAAGLEALQKFEAAGATQ